MKEIIEKLTKLNKTISTMESCTGGGVANAITNIEGASEVIKFSAVTYSNEFKIKMGVDSDVIDKYTVYSMETADEMASNISKFASSDYGVGITGQLNRFDPNNPVSENNKVYISIYDKNKDKFSNEILTVTDKSRKDNKEIVINCIVKLLNRVLDENI